MFTTITTATIAQHVATEDELVLLGQVIDIDGRDAVVLASTAAKNGSGRVIGEHLTITDEAWQFVAESLAQGAEAYGQTPETLDDYAKMADRTDSKRIK